MAHVIYSGGKSLDFLFLPLSDHILFRDFGLQRCDGGLLLPYHSMLFQELIQQHCVHCIVAQVSTSPLASRVTRSGARIASLALSIGLISSLNRREGTSVPILLVELM